MLDMSKIYDVIGIEADDYRLIGERGEPYLYEHEIFDIVDNTRPCDWITEIGSEGEEYSYPPELNGVGFFEDYHDYKAEAIDIFNRYIAQKTK